jgi:hypothetical protein
MSLRVAKVQKVLEKVAAETVGYCGRNPSPHNQVPNSIGFQNTTTRCNGATM